jgi:hypothetical protein
MTYIRYYCLIILKVFANCILKEVFAEVARVVEAVQENLLYHPKLYFGVHLCDNEISKPTI